MVYRMLELRIRGPGWVGARPKTFGSSSSELAHQPPHEAQTAQQPSKPPHSEFLWNSLTRRNSERLNFDATEPPLLPAARLLRLRPAPFGRPFAPRLAAVPAAPLCYSGSVSPASARDRQDPLVARTWQDPVVADRQDPRAAGGPAPEAPLLPAAVLVFVFVSRFSAFDVL
jgi:hypothetical protein